MVLTSVARLPPALQGTSTEKETALVLNDFKTEIKDKLFLFVNFYFVNSIPFKGTENIIPTFHAPDFTY